MRAFMNIAKRVVDEAGKIFFRGFIEAKKVDIYESQKVHLAQNVIYSVNEYIEKFLQEKYPEHLIISEYSENKNNEIDIEEIFKAENCWLISPMDSQINFIHHNQNTAIGLSFLSYGVPVLTVIYNPISRDMYSAIRGNGAIFNDGRLRFNKLSQNAINMSVLATIIAKNSRLKTTSNLLLSSEMLTEFADIRATGSALLDCGLTARAEYDGFFASDLSICQLAAISLISKEAGLITTDYLGTQNIFTQKNIIIAGDKTHTKILDIIRKFYGQKIENKILTEKEKYTELFQQAEISEAARIKSLQTELELEQRKKDAEITNKEKQTDKEKTEKRLNKKPKRDNKKADFHKLKKKSFSDKQHKKYADKKDKKGEFSSKSFNRHFDRKNDKRGK
ncbi:MAG: inositol monophosphatase [Cardiobacteriaceae bacterium]|nr:inositol monophosphatase [Cardiobacteriaceae bacterium]